MRKENNCTGGTRGQPACVHFQTGRSDANAGALLRGQASIRFAAANSLGLRGQASTEMLVLAGFALMFILPLAMLFLSVSNSTLGESSIIQAKTVARTIADEAGEVYLEGPGAKKMIIVNYPEGISGARIDEKLVVLSVDTDGRKLDIVGATFANITGNLSARKKAGLQRILLVNENGNYVNITYG